MTIPHFADHQNLVFLPALGAGLVATVLICLPIVFAPRLRRGSRIRGRVLTGFAFGLGAVALVATGWQAGVGLRTLNTERAAVGATIRTDYGIDLPSGDVNELLNGGAPQVRLTARAEALGVARPQDTHALRLKATTEGASTYDLYFAGKLLTPSA